MRKKLCFAALAALLVAQVAWAQVAVGRSAAPLRTDGFLVDAAEAIAFQGEAGFLEPASLRPRAIVPQIDILKPVPVTDLKVKAPFAITVLFKGQPDSVIVPSTFRVLYGGLKIDITERLTKFIQVTPEGFTLENAKIPQGRHRLTLRVEDDKQRLAERDLRFEVE
ncbi:MAG: hypothetical protein ACKVOO_00320 [Burkholderiaceae bacterium]